MSAAASAEGPSPEPRRDGPIGKAAAAVGQWSTSDPKNLLTLLTLPLVVWESAAQIRWHRAAGISLLSPRGALAYTRARPGRVACSVVVSLLPDVFGLVLRRRRQPR